MTDTDTQKLIDRLYQRGMAEDDSCNPDAGDLMRQAAARITELEALVSASDARVREAVELGAEVVIAYHVAICSPKGVVPDDSFYDPVIVERCEKEFQRARATIPTKERTDV